MTIVYVLGGITSIIFIIVLVIYFTNYYPLRPKEKGYKFVYVEQDGGVRELFEDEKAYLDTNFLPNDGARPYIKSRYSLRTPDNKISGYILRIRVPKEINIKPTEQIDLNKPFTK